MAHIRRDAFPITRGLPHHARRAHDAASKAPELLREQSCHGCAAAEVGDREPGRCYCGGYSAEAVDRAFPIFGFV